MYFGGSRPALALRRGGRDVRRGRRLFPAHAAAAQVLPGELVILGQLLLAEGRPRIGVLHALHRLVKEDGRLPARRPVGGVGRLVAGGAHRVAGPAGRPGVGRVPQQVQRLGGVVFGVQQDPHAQGGVQLLPAGLAAHVGHMAVVGGALLLAAADVLQQGVKAMAARLRLPVPAQDAPADLVTGGLDLKSGLQIFFGHGCGLLSPKTGGAAKTRSPSGTTYKKN